MSVSFDVKARLTVNKDGLAKDVGEKILSVTDPGSNYRKVEIANGQTDKEIAIAFTNSLLKGYWMKSDKDITIETNATDATGGDTIALKANKWTYWDVDDPHTKLFTANVSKMYVTNASGSAAVLEMDFALDSTV